MGVLRTDLANRTGQHNYTMDRDTMELGQDTLPGPVSNPAMASVLYTFLMYIFRQIMECEKKDTSVQLS